VGNNDGGVYFAVLDAETNGVVIATLPASDGGSARAARLLPRMVCSTCPLA